MGIGGFDEKDLDERSLAVGERTIRVVGPRNPEILLEWIDILEFRKDERMPYWAELWPSSIGLARHLVERAPESVAGADVIELGAGLGLGGVAAGIAGARSVLFTDYFEESLVFAAENARRNGVERFETRLLDWREPDLERRYPVVVGADLLFEERNKEPVARVIAATLAPGGLAWVADPGRSTSEGFDAIAGAYGLVVARGAPPIHVEKATVWILEIRKP